MIALRINHKTTYRYHQPISLTLHRLSLRPRESRELRLRSFQMAVTPAAMVNWTQDVFGNAIATATFSSPTELLVIDSMAHVENDAVPRPVFDIAASAITFPFRYADAEWTDLGALTVPQ